jgi:hypothetical protein
MTHTPRSPRFAGMTKFYRQFWGGEKLGGKSHTERSFV